MVNDQEPWLALFLWVITATAINSVTDKDFWLWDCRVLEVLQSIGPPYFPNKTPLLSSGRNSLRWWLRFIECAVGNAGGPEKKAYGDAKGSKPLHIWKLSCLD